MSKDKDLSEWRREHRQEILEENYKTWRMIRDNESASNKDRIEAAKNIARMCAILSPETVTEKKQSTDKESKKKEELSDSEKALIEAMLNDTVS